MGLSGTPPGALSRYRKLFVTSLGLRAKASRLKLASLKASCRLVRRLSCDEIEFLPTTLSSRQSWTATPGYMDPVVIILPAAGATCRDDDSMPIAYFIPMDDNMKSAAKHGAVDMCTITCVHSRQRQKAGLIALLV